MESFMAPGCRTIEWTGIIATLENQNRIRIQVCEIMFQLGIFFLERVSNLPDGS